MELHYNLAEVFEIAEQIERNGAAFYRQAVGICESDMVKKFLLLLADQEDEHEKTFTKLHQQAVAPDAELAAHDEDEVVASYLKALAGQYVFSKTIPAESMLTGKETMPDILDMAIGQEKDSIILYQGMMDAMRDGDEKEHVGKILREEQKHLTDLLNKKNTV